MIVTDRDLLEKLMKIEALHAGAKTDGERDSAFKAKQRILKKIQDAVVVDPPIEYKFTLHNGWSVRVFVALLERYGIKPYRRPKQRRTTVLAKVSVSFVDNVLWPEYLEIQDEIDNYFDAKIDNVVIRLKNKD